LNFGGMERIAAVLANYIASQDLHAVHLITLSKQAIAFEIHPKVIFHQPEFDTTQMTFIDAALKAMRFVRGIVRKVKPYSVLSLGDRYNSLAVLSTFGLGIKVYVSNRMNPSLSNGMMIDVLNKVFYRYAKGIIAQTEHAKHVFLRRYGNKNIAVISNPVHLLQGDAFTKEQFILNVGRFADQKNQHLLIRYYRELSIKDWKLVFLGDGYKKQQALDELEKAEDKSLIKIIGFERNVEAYYQKSAIFAFTSTSEGFPNVLAEAMSAGCACISFDCEAGPSELIDDGINGFLIPVGDHEQYKEKLQLLIVDSELRARFGHAAQEKMKQFSVEHLAQRFLDFLLSA
jgi:GalNAc-alpha-(1->4)-GalNAc-alpha-(1->3)-diNAcBac-PP-undecaprenol alpha-1,4-N-acetyl-D-galactosaminyltransferase